MATQRQTFPVEFKGGLISSMSPLQQGLNAVGSATKLQNFEPSKEGGYKKVLGYTKYISGQVAGSGKILGVKVANAEKVITIRKNGSNLSEYYINVSSAWVSLGAAPSLGGRVRGVNFNFNGDDKIFFVDGTNRPAVFNDTGDTLTFPATSASFPVDLTGSSFTAELNGTLFAGNGTNLIFSSPYNELDWSSASGGGIINVGKTITGLITFRNSLIIFCENGIKNLVGTSSSDFVLSNITSDLGCPYPDTIQEVGGDIMFLGPDGIRYLSASERIDDFGLELASAPIETDIKELIRGSSLFSSLTLKEKGQYRLFAYVEGLSDKLSNGVLATKFSNQDSSNVAWGTLLGFKAYCADSNYESGREYIVFANEDGYVYKLEDGFTRDGEPIRAVYRSPVLPITDPTKRKTLYKLALYTSTIGLFSVDLNIYYDGYKISNYNGINPPTITLDNAGGGVYIWGSSEAVYGTAVYGGQLDNIFDANVIGAGKTFSIVIKDSSLNPSFTLDTMIIEYREHDRQ